MFVKVADQGHHTVVTQLSTWTTLRGGFPLKKENSNDQNVLESVPIHDRAKEVKELDFLSRDL